MIKRIYISLILLIIISLNINNEFLYNFIFSNNIKYINMLDINKIFINKKESRVSNNDIDSFEKVGNSYRVYSITNYSKVLEEGTVIFIGNKDKLDNTVTILTKNGIYYDYSNIDNISVHLYDHINKNEIIGSINEYYYLTLYDNNGYLEYENKD